MFFSNVSGVKHEVLAQDVEGATENWNRWSMTSPCSCICMEASLWEVDSSKASAEIFNPQSLVEKRRWNEREVLSVFHFSSILYVIFHWPQSLCPFNLKTVETNVSRWPPEAQYWDGHFLFCARVSSARKWRHKPSRRCFPPATDLTSPTLATWTRQWHLLWQPLQETVQQVRPIVPGLEVGVKESHGVGLETLA